MTFSFGQQPIRWTGAPTPAEIAEIQAEAAARKRVARRKTRQKRLEQRATELRALRGRIVALVRHTRRRIVGRLKIRKFTLSRETASRMKDVNAQIAEFTSRRDRAAVRPAKLRATVDAGNAAAMSLTDAIKQDDRALGQLAAGKPNAVLAALSNRAAQGRQAADLALAALPEAEAELETLDATLAQLTHTQDELVALGLVETAGAELALRYLRQVKELEATLSHLYGFAAAVTAVDPARNLARQQQGVIELPTFSIKQLLVEDWGGGQGYHSHKIKPQPDVIAAAKANFLAAAQKMGVPA